MQFSEFHFSENVIKGIEKAGFQECMPVQEQVFFTALKNKRDVAVQSQTGSGKTAAFLLTIFELFEREPEAHHQALIIAPTRELAVQIEQEAQLLGSGLEYKIGCFYGGTGYGKQEQMLRDGPDIIIGTPGRLLDFASSGKMSLKEVDMIIIDEADRLFDMGFFPDLKKILRKTSKPEERQTMLFSATLSSRVSQLAWEFMNNAEEIVINPDDLTVQEIKQQLYHVPSEEKLSLLLGILKRDTPQSSIIFTNTKDMAVKVAKRLSANGYQAEYLMGDLPQKKRLQIIKKIKEGKLEILVATDVAARGLHIDDLEMVINYDVPEDPENYVHRIGRTARAGKSGKAVTLACERFVYGLEPIQELIDMKIPVEWADEELLSQEDKSAGMRIESFRNQRKSSSRQKRSEGGSRRSSSSRNSNSNGPGRSAAPRKEMQEQKGSNRSEKNGKKRDSAESRRAAQSKGSERRGQAVKGKGPKKGLGPKTDKAPISGGSKPSKHDDIDTRLEYYRRKYGEDFQLTDSSAETNKKSSQRSAGRTAQKPAQKKSAASKHSEPQQSASRTEKKSPLIKALGKLFRRD